MTCGLAVVNAVQQKRLRPAGCGSWAVGSGQRAAGHGASPVLKNAGPCYRHGFGLPGSVRARGRYLLEERWKRRQE